MKHEKINNILLTAALTAGLLYFAVSTCIKLIEHGLTNNVYDSTTKQERIKFVQDSIYNEKSIELRNKQLKQWQ